MTAGDSMTNEQLRAENDRLRARVGELEASTQQMARAGVVQAMVAQIYGVPYHELFWRSRPIGHGALNPPAAVLI